MGRVEEKSDEYNQQEHQHYESQPPEMRPPNDQQTQPPQPQQQPPPQYWQQPQQPPPQYQQQPQQQPPQPQQVRFPPQQNPPPQMNMPNGKHNPAAYPPQNPQATMPPQQPQPQPTYYQPQPAPYGYPPQNAVHAYPTPPTASLPAHQPAAPVVPGTQNPIGTEGWSSGLFDCMNDPMNALITVLFPCLTFGQIAEIIDSGHTSCGTSGMIYTGVAFCFGVPCIMSCTYRTKMRSRFNLVEAPAPDWITHFLCEYCALCQEYRELQYRGFDPSIGWHGNLAKSQQAAMAPPVNQRMMG